MLVKRALLITCAMIATVATVRSQTLSAPPLAADEPPPPAADLVIARPSRPAALPVTVTKRTSAPAPFVLETTPPPAPATSPNAQSRPAAVDVSALRYFASQNDLARVAAEIRLLRSTYPDWEPPEDLFSDAGSSVDEQPLWDLFAKHDLPAVHAKIDELAQANPGWHPSSDLTNKLALSEAHDSLVKASDARQWGSVIDVASGTKMLLTCADVDALWRTAEALIQTGDEPRGAEVYRYTLSTCTPPDLRLATVQKASLLLKSPDALDSLLQMGRRLPDGRNEFEQIRLDQVRRKVGAAAAGTSPLQPTQAEIDALSANATGPAGQADAQLLGWYSYARKDYGAAQRWFKAALQIGPNAKAAEGLVLALRDGGDADQAHRLAVQYAGLDQPNRKLMVEILSASLADPKASAPTPDELSALTKAIDELKSADGAQSLGWHLYRSNDLAGADTWFRKSADWMPNEAAAVGLVVTARRLHHDQDYAALIARYRGTFPRIAELETMMRSRPRVATVRGRHDARPARIASLGRRKAGGTGGGWDASADQIVKVYDAGQYQDAMALLEQRRQKRAEPGGLSVIRGWALYHKGDWEGAKQVFSNLNDGKLSREKQEGLRVIELGYTNPRYR